MTSLTTMMQGPVPVCAPLVLDPMMARMAEKAGFKALYLGGGSMGYQRVYLEANLTLTEMAQAALEIRTTCDLPLIFDGAAGWGDPMHMHRTIGMAEAAGFTAIEIEDQILPKRAHHHVGIDHMVPMEFMVDKIKEAVRARRNPDFHIIARTIATRSVGMDDAVRAPAPGEALGRLVRQDGDDMIHRLRPAQQAIGRHGAEIAPQFECFDGKSSHRGTLV